LPAPPLQCWAAIFVPGEDAGHDSGSGSLRAGRFLLSLLVIWPLDRESSSRFLEPFRETSHQFSKFRSLTTAVENARSVRKNPQDSRLVKLRARKEFERQNITFDFGPR
jgi:hypothetical protein